jgi:hypothetical protein
MPSPSSWSMVGCLLPVKEFVWLNSSRKRTLSACQATHLVNGQPPEADESNTTCKRFLGQNFYMESKKARTSSPFQGPIPATDRRLSERTTSSGSGEVSIVPDAHHLRAWRSSHRTSFLDAKRSESGVPPRLEGSLFISHSSLHRLVRPNAIFLRHNTNKYALKGCGSSVMFIFWYEGYYGSANGQRGFNDCLLSGLWHGLKCSTLWSYWIRRMIWSIKRALGS